MCPAPGSGPSRVLPAVRATSRGPASQPYMWSIVGQIVCRISGQLPDHSWAHRTPLELSPLVERAGHLMSGWSQPYSVAPNRATYPSSNLGQAGLSRRQGPSIIGRDSNLVQPEVECGLILVKRSAGQTGCRRRRRFMPVKSSHAPPLHFTGPGYGPNQDTKSGLPGSTMH